jgi:hypothetical protein
MAAPELDLTRFGLADVVACPSAGHLRPAMINLRTNATAVELRTVVKAAEKTDGLRMLALDPDFVLSSSSKCRLERRRPSPT